MKAWLQLGYVSRIFGTKGEVVVKTFHAQSQSLRFAKVLQFHLKTGEARTLRVKERGPLNEGWKLCLEGTYTPEEARCLVGSRVKVAREDLGEPEEGAFFVEDWIGLEARLESGEVLGHVSSLLHAGAVPNLIIHNAQGEEWMVPWTDEYVPKLCMEEGYVVVRPLELD